MDYKQFLSQKRVIFKGNGLDVSDGDINELLFPFQRDLTRWALRKGRAAIFADTGLGKTFMQVEWARIVNQKTDFVLIIAPLSVARQTVNEAKKLGVEVTYSRDGKAYPITITNYEMMDYFKPEQFAGVVLDESSILKSIDGKTRQQLIDIFGNTEYRLCCTATPAPNDISEIANHSEFLGILRRTDMLSAFFVHDDEGWRLKAHARQPFYEWLASWGMSIKKPSDLGYDDEGYILPELTIKPIFVNTDFVPDGQIVFTGMHGIKDRIQVRQSTVNERCNKTAEFVNESDEQWIIWTGLNPESNLVHSLVPDSVEVQGSDSIEHKLKSIQDFQDGRVRVLVTKPKIAGMGMNFQNAHNMVFMGLNDSWEAYYQCIRREYRFGQQYPVNVFIVISDAEQEVYQNIKRKEFEANQMNEELIKNVQRYEIEEISTGQLSSKFNYRQDDKIGKDYHLMLGDSCERLKELADNSIDLTVFSPPFASLYTYSPSDRDLGNCQGDDEFFVHFGFIIDELLRVVKPGRICAVHVFDIPAMQVRDGYIGLKDFSGDVLREFIKHGWIYDSRIPIDKNQQAQSIRTHAKGLTMTQMEKDRTWSRPALPDYILKFRKPGENQVPVKDGDITRDLWIEWANPTWPSDDDRCAEIGNQATWYGIAESETLQGFRSGKWHRNNGGNDERHICPLQLPVYERVIRLWSNRGETILEPFLGIGSGAVVALRLNRKAIGIELKGDYFAEACKNVEQVASEKINLFDLMGIK